jgi:MFS family permease
MQEGSQATVTLHSPRRRARSNQCSLMARAQVYRLPFSAMPAAVTLAAVVGGVCHGLIVGGMSAFFVELFPTAARYTGFSAGYQLASVASGAVAPLIGVALLEAFHSTVPVSLYAAAMTVPALLALARSPETRGADLARVE